LRQPLSLYLHVPFCDWKCTYCDFNSYAGLEDLIPPFIEALEQEIELWAPMAEGRTIETIFFGGGTPSLLGVDQVERILATIWARFQVSMEPEVSLEANPGTVDIEKLRGLREVGVTRLSFGVQSFDAGELKFLTRIHDAETARRTYKDAREAGFDNINLDFIFGLPGQTADSWQRTLDEAIALRPEHLSLYILTVEENTPLGHDVVRGLVREADPDFVAELYGLTERRMADAGYRQYEISNWSLPGRQCRHNLNYWRNGEWLALGPGAHSHFDGNRFAVVRSPQRYIRAMAEEAGKFPFAVHEQVEEQSLEDEMADTAWLGLRLNEGLDLEQFELRFCLAFGDAFPELIARFAPQGLLQEVNGRLTLTNRGRLLSNEVFAALVG
jgi:oxygen-independent coproporphyrinogen-3 oxidase